MVLWAEGQGCCLIEERRVKGDWSRIERYLRQVTDHQIGIDACWELELNGL